MANRQTYVVGALGVLVGIVVGANSAQRAEVVSYAGHDPNNEVIQNMPQLNRAAQIWRQRSGTGLNYYTAPRRSSVEDNVARRLEQRLGDMNMYGSAPTVLGEPAQARQVVPACAQYTRQRYSRCLEAFIRGEEFVPNYYPIEYDS